MSSPPPHEAHAVAALPNTQDPIHKCPDHQIRPHTHPHLVAVGSSGVGVAAPGQLPLHRRLSGFAACLSGWKGGEFGKEDGVGVCISVGLGGGGCRGWGSCTAAALALPPGRFGSEA